MRMFLRAPWVGSLASATHVELLGESGWCSGRGIECVLATLKWHTVIANSRDRGRFRFALDERRGLPSGMHALRNQLRLR